MVEEGQESTLENYAIADIAEESDTVDFVKTQEECGTPRAGHPSLRAKSKACEAEEPSTSTAQSDYLNFALLKSLGEDTIAESVSKHRAEESLPDTDVRKQKLMIGPQ